MPPLNSQRSFGTKVRKVLIFCLFFPSHGLVLKLGPFPSDLLPPQPLSGWIMPKFKPSPLRVCSSLRNAQLLVPSPLPGRFPIPSQTDLIPSQNKILYGCAGTQSSTSLPCSSTPPKIQPRGLYLRRRGAIPQNSRLNFLSSPLLPSQSRGKDEDEDLWSQMK